MNIKTRNKKPFRNDDMGQDVVLNTKSIIYGCWLKAGN